MSRPGTSTVSHSSSDPFPPEKAGPPGPGPSPGEVEKTESGADPSSDPGTDPGADPVPFDGPGTKRLLRKIDRALIPLLVCLYLLSFLDRTNIGNARLDGMEAALGLRGIQYNVALAVFFPFYVLAEIPSNVMMKRTRPSFWIPFIMLCWGAVCTLMGLVHNFAGLVAARAALGLAEGGLFPGITFFITMWYRRHECGFRMAVFFSAATAAGAFGGLFARAISEMDGLAGTDGWAWIFIIEGLLTVAVAIAAFFFMHDYPATARFLTAPERAEVARRLAADRSGLADEFEIRFVWDALRDWKIWVHALITVGIYIPLYSYALFLPTIVRDLGYTASTAQLMTVPPYVVASVFCIGGGYFADRAGQRGVFMVGFCAVGLVGLAVLVAAPAAPARYVGTVLLAVGIYPNVPQGVAWNGNNIGGSLKRAVGIAVHVGIGNLGGVVAAFIYLARDGPRYYPGHGTLMGTMGMSMVLCAGMSVWLRRENDRRDRVFGDPAAYSDEDRARERAKGDNASFFRYTV